MLTDFLINSFTTTLLRKFAIKRLQILPDLDSVATRPCEILVNRNRVDRKHSNGRPGVGIVRM